MRTEAGDRLAKVNLQQLLRNHSRLERCNMEAGWAWGSLGTAPKGPRQVTPWRGEAGLVHSLLKLLLWFLGKCLFPRASVFPHDGSQWTNSE